MLRRSMPLLRMWQIGEGQAKHRPVHWADETLDWCSLALLLALQRNQWATERGKKGWEHPRGERKWLWRRMLAIKRKKREEAVLLMACESTSMSSTMTS